MCLGREVFGNTGQFAKVLKGLASEVIQTWTLILAVSFTSYVILDKLLSFRM